MNKIILTLMLGMLLISFVCAEDLVYKQNTVIDLKVPCSNNGTACSVGATCDITIIDPDSITIVDNQAMNNLGSGIFNYSLSPLQKLGSYPTTVYCLDGGLGGSTTFPFEITQTGYNVENEFKKLVWLYSLAIILYFILLFIAWKMEFAWLGFLAGTMMLVPGIHLMINSFGLSDYILTRGIAIVFLAIALITIVVFSMEFIEARRDDFQETEDDYDYYKEDNSQA